MYSALRNEVYAALLALARELTGKGDLGVKVAHALHPRNEAVVWTHIRRMLLERNAHELCGDKECVDAVAREHVPPAVAFEENGKRVADRVAGSAELCAKDVVDVPQEEASKECNEANELEAARVAADLARLGRLRESRLGMEEHVERVDRDVRKYRRVCNLVEHRVAVGHVRIRDPRDERKDAERQHQAAARPAVARCILKHRVADETVSETRTRSPRSLAARHRAEPRASASCGRGKSPFRQYRYRRSSR